MTIHADEEMDEDGLTVHDVENAILTGSIVERRKDRETSEANFLVRGKTVSGTDNITTVTKFGFVGNLVVTAYVE